MIWLLFCFRTVWAPQNNKYIFKYTVKKHRWSLQTWRASVGGPLRISASSCFSPPTRRRPGGVFMWAAGRWCSAASGRRSGRSCWTGCSCSPLQTAAPGRPEPAERRRAGAGGRQPGGPGRRGVDVGTNPSAPPWKTEVKDCYNGLFNSKTWTHVLLKVNYDFFS